MPEFIATAFPFSHDLGPTGRDGRFLRAYLAAAEWTLDEEDMEKDYTVFSEDSMKVALLDCKRFRLLIGSLYEKYGETQLAYDFWLTRNHHGTGFWDRHDIYDKDDMKILDEIADGFGEQVIYVGDDCQVWLEG